MRLKREEEEKAKELKELEARLHRARTKRQLNEKLKVGRRVCRSVCGVCVERRALSLCTSYFGYLVQGFPSSSLSPVARAKHKSVSGRTRLKMAGGAWHSYKHAPQ